MKLVKIPTLGLLASVLRFSVGEKCTGAKNGSEISSNITRSAFLTMLWHFTNSNPLLQQKIYDIDFFAKIRMSKDSQEGLPTTPKTPTQKMGPDLDLLAKDMFDKTSTYLQGQLEGESKILVALWCSYGPMLKKQLDVKLFVLIL